MYLIVFVFSLSISNPERKKKTCQTYTETRSDVICSQRDILLYMSVRWYTKRELRDKVNFIRQNICSTTINISEIFNSNKQNNGKVYKFKELKRTHVPECCLSLDVQNELYALSLCIFCSVCIYLFLHAHKKH